MANWKYTLDIKDIWQQAKDDEITVQELAKETANRLENLKIKEKYYPMDEVDELISFSEDEEADKYNFDDVMSRLYDWADRDHICWIATFK